MTIGEEAMGQERSVLRWGGLAGILGSLVFLLVPIVLFGFVPQPQPGSFKVEGGAQVDPAGLVSMFPTVRATISVGNFLNFLSSVLSLALFIALFRALRGKSLAPALFGTALLIMGLAVIFTETVTQVAFDPISSLYHAPGVTLADQATITIAWQAVQAIFFELDAAAILLFSAGYIVIGTAMFRAPAFGKIVGGLTTVFGAIALVVVSFFGITSYLAAVLLVPVFIVLPVMLGWKVYRLSKVAP
jgi:hypothetical protein